MIGRIKGLGSYLPSKVVTNKDLESVIDTSDEWITERTGIKQRHISDPLTETASAMAVIAAKEAVADAGIDPMEIELIVVASTTNNMVFPTCACIVQREIGADNAQCFDMNSACPGFLAAYNVAQSFIEANQIKKALVVGSEVPSNFVDWNDRGVCILFGDGAGAMILEAEDSERTNKFIMRASGKRADCLNCENPKQRLEGEAMEALQKRSFFYMEGREVFKFAVTEVPKIITDLCEKYELDINDIDMFVLHQANQRIIEAVSKRLSVPLEKFPMCIAEMGNTSAASIPILLTKLKKEGKLKEGQKIIMSSFGAGLTWGATYFEY